MKRAGTHGGFLKIPKNKIRTPIALNANITMHGWTIYLIAITVALVAMDVRDRERNRRMTSQRRTVSQGSRKSAKRVATNGGFPKILKKKPKSQIHASNANITMHGWTIWFVNTVAMVAMDVRDRKRNGRMKIHGSTLSQE